MELCSREEAGEICLISCENYLMIQHDTGWQSATSFAEGIKLGYNIIEFG